MDWITFYVTIYKTKTENIIQLKSFAFSVRIVNIYKNLIFEKKEFLLSKQLLRSATSIDANIEEAIGGQSGKDSFSKISICCIQLINP